MTAGHDDEHTDIAVELPVFSLERGTNLGEYVIEGRIGEGAMGVVFSAVHPTIGKRAAVKVLRAELCEDEMQVERFIDEARAVNQIGHPNIVDIFAFGEMPDGRRYFVMELLKGETLRDRLRRGKMSVAEASAVIRPLARALEAAHEKGVIHRDLKPENVFLVQMRDDAPQIKLLDFGVAKLNNDAHRMYKTGAGELVGTPMYIAPEQARGGAGVDARADIYALGAIAFELLCGRPPFLGKNTFEMVTAHLMEAPPVPSSIVPGIPPEIDDLLLAMLAKDPAARPALADVRMQLGIPEQTPAPYTPTRAPSVMVPRAAAVSMPMDSTESAPVVIARSGRGLGIAAAVLGTLGVAAVVFVLLRGTGAPTPQDGPLVAVVEPPIALPDAAPPDAVPPIDASSRIQDAARPVPPDAAIAETAGRPHNPLPAIAKTGHVLLQLKGAASATFSYDGKQHTGSRLDTTMSLGPHTIGVKANGTTKWVKIDVAAHGVVQTVQVPAVPVPIDDHALMPPDSLKKP